MTLWRWCATKSHGHNTRTFIFMAPLGGQKIRPKSVSWTNHITLLCLSMQTENCHDANFTDTCGNGCCHMTTSGATMTTKLATWQHLLFSVLLFNVLRSKDAHVRRRTRSSLIEVMACRLFGAKPLSRPILDNCQWDPKEHISIKSYLKIKRVHRKAFENVLCRLSAILSWLQCLNTLRCGASGCHFADDIFLCILSNTFFRTFTEMCLWESNATETKMSSFWRNFHHWLHWKLSFWQLSVQPVMKISSKWRHFRFSGRINNHW